MKNNEIVITYHQKYCFIAQDSYLKVLRLTEEISKIEGSFRKSKKLSDEEDRLIAEKWGTRNDYIVLTIVFSALSLEACINNYAIERLSKRYLKNYLDKLNLVSKWIIIPQIVTGQQLDPGSEPIQNLGWLVNQRNNLVHFKTKKVKSGQLKASDFLWPVQAEKALDTVRIVVLALKKIDKTVNVDWLPSPELSQYIKKQIERI
ncbi:MAG: hypothetical protein E3J75_01500 [Dehalococcoidia bacterium]|nr:MAG: hypothetical protein E3J75_01500 [Dehalococcoidia bacterium]